MDTPQNETASTVEQERLVRLWVARLKRLLRDAPPEMVALVGHGAIRVYNNKDALRASEEHFGHAENAECDHMVIESDCFEPHGESV